MFQKVSIPFPSSVGILHRRLHPRAPAGPRAHRGPQTPHRSTGKPHTLRHGRHLHCPESRRCSHNAQVPVFRFQIPLLADGIRIHGEKATEQLKPLHNRLVTCFQDLREKVEKHYGVITLVRCQPQTQFNVRGCQLKPMALLPSYQTLLIQSRVYIILAQDHKSSFSRPSATRVLPVIVLLPCQDSPDDA